MNGAPPARRLMRALPLFLLAAVAEIVGCWLVWRWTRGAPAALAAAALAPLFAFAWLIARSDAAAPGRAFAAYGGVYIATALVWLAVADGVRPDRWDLLGAALCLAGAGVIMLGPRAA
jgi:small multidrug resistance family-3 protein